MLKRFDQIITEFDGTPFQDGKGEMTIGRTIVTALLAAHPDEMQLPGEEKLKRYILAERIYGAGATPTEVSAENIVLIKACIAKAYGPAVVGFVFQYLESDGEPKKKASPTLKAVSRTLTEAGAKG